MELDRVVVPERSTTRPVLESYARPEVSMILVLDAAELLLLLIVEALLPDIAERVLVLDLPESPAIADVDLFAELVRYAPVLLPDRLLVKLL